MPFVKIIKNLKIPIVAFLLSAIIFWIVLEDDISLFECNIEISILEDQGHYQDKPTVDYFKDKDIPYQIEDSTIILKQNVDSENECRVDFLIKVNSVLKRINTVQEKNSLQEAKLLSQKIDVLTEELQGLQTQLYELKAKEEEVKEKNQQLSEQREEVLERINYLKTQKEKLLLIYTPSHPDIINLEQELAFYEDKLKQFPEAEKLSIQLQDKLSQKASTYSEKRKELIALEEKLAGVSEIANSPLEVESVSVFELEKEQPSKTSKIVLYSGAISLCILFIGFIFDKKTYSIRDLRKFKNLSLVSKMPKIAKRGKLFSIPFDSSMNTNAFLEGVASFLKEKRVIFISSPDLKSGKTTLALNLAAFLSKEGKRAVLVDFNFKNAALTKKILVKKEGIFINDAADEAAIDKKIFNFSHLALERPKLEAFITKQGLDRLSIIFTKPKKRADLFVYQDLIRRLKNVYDYVICDCASFSEDLLRLSEEPEAGLLFVVRCARTKKAHIRRVEESLNFDKIGVKGVIFNTCT